MTSPRFPPRYYRTIPSNEEFSGFKQIPRRMIMIWGERRYGRGEKILEIENQAGPRRGLSLRSVLLLLLLVGVGVGPPPSASIAALPPAAAPTTPTLQSPTAT